MRTRLVMAAWLVVVWVALWGDLSAANVAGGVLVAGLVLAAFPNAGPRRLHAPRLGALVRFAGYFVKELVVSNAVVTWEVVTPGSSIAEGIIAVELEGAGEAVATLVANAITLTPGTLTVATRATEGGHVLYVHVLHLRDAPAAREQVRYLGYLALRAFGDAQVRDGLVDPRSRPAQVAS